jgi:hypothetical protein
MSTEHGHGQGGGASGDSVDYGKVVGVGVASLVVFAISIWVASIVWHSAMNEAESKAGHARAFDTHRTEIGIVDQVPFASDTRLHTWKGARKQELDTYGWIDKSKGVVRIPIQAAMDKVVSGAMPAGAPR